MRMSVYLPKGPRKVDTNCAERALDRPHCKVCALIRVYLTFAIPLIFLAFAGVEIDWPDLDMTAVVGYLFLAAFLIQLSWRFYVDYIKKK